MANSAGFDAITLGGDLGFLLGGVDASSLIGAFVKSVTAAGAVTVQGSDGAEATVQISIPQVWSGTQAEYDAITSPDGNTFYVVTDG